jgi:hypothetical protein
VNGLGYADYWVYDSAGKSLTYDDITGPYMPSYANGIAELFSGTYTVKINGSIKTTSIQTGNQTILRVGTLTLLSGQRLYDASGNTQLISYSSSNGGIRELFPGTYIIKEGYGNDETSRTATVN